jgi:hypothetical protein
MKKILELGEDAEKMLAEIIDTYMKSKGISALDLVNKLIANIKQVEEPPKAEG